MASLTHARFAAPVASARGLVPAWVLLVACLCSASPRAATSVRDDGPEELAEMAVEQLDDGIDHYDYKAMEEALIDIDSVYAKVSDKVRKRLDKALAQMLGTRPAREIDWDDRTQDASDKLLPAYRLAVGIVYDKESGLKLMTDALKSKHVKEWAGARALLVEALGQRQDPELVGLLGGYLEDEHADVVSVAARVFRGYSEADVEVRRKCTKLLIDAWLKHFQAAEKEERKSRGKEEDRHDFLIRVEGAFAASLTSLARQAFTQPTEWRDWFAEHGAEESF